MCLTSNTLHLYSKSWMWMCRGQCSCILSNWVHMSETMWSGVTDMFLKWHWDLRLNIGLTSTRRHNHWKQHFPALSEPRHMNVEHTQQVHLMISHGTQRRHITVIVNGLVDLNHMMIIKCIFPHSVLLYARLSCNMTTARIILYSNELYWCHNLLNFFFFL